MSGCIKYFQNGRKVMPFITEDGDDLLTKYNEIYNKIKKTSDIKLHSKLVYDEKYIKAKVKEFNGVVNTNILDDQIPKKREHYTCIACIVIDYVMKIEKKNYPQVYLEECKYKLKMKKMSEFIDVRFWFWQ